MILESPDRKVTLEWFEMELQQEMERRLHISEGRKRFYQSPEGMAMRKQLSSMSIGVFHPHWRGDFASYGSLHEWIRAWKPKPELCERCHQRPPREVHNISGELRRDLADFIWLCSKCHHQVDGRTEKSSERLRELARLRIGTHRDLT
jgi:hypothetical protein